MQPLAVETIVETEEQAGITDLFNSEPSVHDHLFQAVNFESL